MQFTVKRFFIWKYNFIKSFPTIHVFIWINTFLNNKKDLLVCPLQHLYVFGNFLINTFIVLYLWF